MLRRMALEWREKGHVRGGQFNGGRIIVMAVASLKTENGLEVVSLKEGEWSC